ncbi:HlyD family secretion protein [Bradyrhizobium septentrionale]|uniref:HlyD family secretion protein n=1 Tax=Bradyrhizobium septentrionale TaxID=1404411 RepID=A0A974A3C9_9BRAD|nr:HlyD family secretion protein [Bradyrhizobium septentrionale]UGY15653.1 HlyD family secretion protein [Bradyrhizobium septentrionale]UGY24229.1 HlyD family secretion protein [Bradyrhizobium septentrionale]
MSSITALKKVGDVPEAGQQVAPTTPAKKRSRARILLGIIAFLVITCGGIYARQWYAVGRYIESTNNAYLRADQVAMAPRVAGQVSEIYVKDNEDVAVGQPLVKIDPRRYEMTVRQSLATVEARQADIAKGAADLREQDAVIAQAQADVETARVNSSLAEKEFERSSSLAARGFGTQQKNDQTESTLAQARSTVTLKQAILDAARQKVATLKAQLAQADAQLAAAKENLAQAEIDLSDTVVRSPIAGRVGDRTVQLGQFAQPGTRLLTVVPTGQIYLVANFKETQVENMRPGQPAEISVDAYPNLPLTGTVDSFAPGTGARFALLPPENATGNFTKIVQRVPVRIRVDAPRAAAPAFVPGLSIEVSVNTKPGAVHSGGGAS